MGCSTSIAKIILFTFNIAFFIFGVASLGVGIWVTVSKNKLFEFINLIDGRVAENSNKEQIQAVADQSGLIVIAAYVLIAIGAFTLIVGFCGCCGAFKESTILLNIYAFLVGVVLALEILVAVLALVFQQKIQGGAERALRDLQEKYYVSLYDYIQNGESGKAAVTYLINFVQVQFDCCGADGVVAARNSSSWISSNRTWPNDRTIVNPMTCCQLKDGASKQLILAPDYVWENFPNELKDSNCPFDLNSRAVVNQTCYAGITGFVSQYSMPITVVCIVIALLEILGIVFACCLVSALRNN